MGYSVIFLVVLVSTILWLIYKTVSIFREGFQTKRIGKIIFLIFAFCFVGFFVMMFSMGVMSGWVNTRGPITYVYKCDGEKAISITFRKYAPNLTLSDGRYIEFSDPEYSGQGPDQVARYVNTDKSIIWISQSKSGYLEERGKVTYSNCRS